MRESPTRSVAAVSALGMCLMLSPAAAGEGVAQPARYGRLPLHFEPNLGQSAPDVRFVARGAGYGLFLAPREARLDLEGRATLRLQLLGASPSPVMTGARQLPGRSHYFLGRDPAGWRTGVPHYARVECHEVYPGIDVVYYGDQGRLEYDFILAGGARVQDIRLGFEGARRVGLDAQGDLVLELPGGQVVHKAPVLYQESGSERRPVAGRFVMRGPSEVGFEVEAYDTTRPLVLDPVLVYSTYLGGGGWDYGSAIAADATGAAYVTGATRSTNFPTANAMQSTNAAAFPEFNAFVSKLDPSGTSLVYSTYLGGAGGAYGEGIAVDASGNVYVVGVTTSDFPTVNPLQPNPGGGFDAFLAKLNPDGSALVYSTYLGGSANDRAHGVAVDGDGQPYLTGETYSADFPKAQPLQAECQAIDAFVTKLNAAGSAFVYSTCLGGTVSSHFPTDIGRAIAVDASGQAYVTGSTESANFPVVNAYQASLQGLDDAFVAKLNAAGSALVYSTYLGGFHHDEGRAIALDAQGRAHVAGMTVSDNFPTVNAFQLRSRAGAYAFVTKFQQDGSAPAYSTYLGGSSKDEATGIAVDPRGNAYVLGTTGSPSGFPLVHPIQATYAGNDDFFVAKLNAQGSALVYASYLGGHPPNGNPTTEGRDWSHGIAVDPRGNAYVTGETLSNDFPVASPLQPANAGFGDALVARISGLRKGDLDDDGATDLFLANTLTGEQRVWFMNGTVRIADQALNPATPASATLRVSGVDDFDGDMRNDLVFRDSSSGAVEFWLLNGVNRVGSALPLVGPTLPREWRLAASADFDLDRNADLVWRNATTQKLVIWTMNGVAKQGEIVPVPDQAAHANWEIVAALDFDHEGHTDLLWYNVSSGRIVQWLMDASVQRLSGRFTNPPNAGDANWKVLAAGDYGAGPGGIAGSNDVLWRNQTSGRLVVWHLDFAGNRTSGTFTTPAAPAGRPTEWTVVGPR